MILDVKHIIAIINISKHAYIPTHTHTHTPDQCGACDLQAC